MSFINIKKVELPNTTDVIRVLTDVALVYASALHDSVESKDYELAKQDVVGLSHSLANVAYKLYQISCKPREHHNWCDFSDDEKKENNRWFCCKCNSPVDENQKFCPECGQTVDWS
jgi:rubrerythrin